MKSPVVQTNDYYPFGLTFNSYSRENSIPNRWKFQGQEHIDDLGLGWDSFKWRNHQPDIGRFFGVDKLAEKYYYNSPYAFSENKVVAHRELEGLEAEMINKEIKKQEANWNHFVDNVKSVLSSIKRSITQDGKTDIEKKNSTPVAIKEKQQDQVKPTNTATGEMDGVTNPQYNKDATPKGDSESKTVMTQTGGQNGGTNPIKDPSQARIDTVWSSETTTVMDTQKDSTFTYRKYETSDGRTGEKLEQRKKGAWSWTYK